MDNQFIKNQMHPQHLEEEEVQNPYLALYRFFDHKALPEVRESLKEWIRVTVIGDYCDLRKRERSNLMYFISHMERLVEAAHVVNQRKHPAKARNFTCEKSLNDCTNNNRELLEQEDDLKEITEKVLSMTNAEKIFLINDVYNTYEDTEFDLLVAVPDSSQIPYEELIINIKAELHELGDITSLVLINANRLYQLLNEGHLFYSLACVKSKLLFDDGQSLIPQLEFVPRETIAKKATESFNCWLKKANGFLIAADLIITKNNDHGLALFLLHQSIELVLRSLLINVAGVELKTHSISTLIEQCARYIPQAAEFFNFSEDPELRIELNYLQYSYIQGRYSCEFTVEKFIVEAISKRSKAFHEFALTEFLNIIETFRSESYVN